MAFDTRFNAPRKLKRAKRIDAFNIALNESEHSQQVALFIYASEQEDLRWRDMFAIPNGGARDKITAAKLRAEGVKPGVPDIFLAVPCKGFNGLFLEMKRADGRVSELQSDWMERLRKRGYCCMVCRSFVQAKEAIEKYLQA